MVRAYTPAHSGSACRAPEPFGEIVASLTSDRAIGSRYSARVGHLHTWMGNCEDKPATWSQNAGDGAQGRGEIGNIHQRHVVALLAIREPYTQIIRQAASTQSGLFLVTG